MIIVERDLLQQANIYIKDGKVIKYRWSKIVKLSSKKIEDLFYVMEVLNENRML